MCTDRTYVWLGNARRCQAKRSLPLQRMQHSLVNRALQLWVPWQPLSMLQARSQQRHWLIGLRKRLMLLCPEHLLCLGCTRSFKAASFGRKDTATLHLQTSGSCPNQAPWNHMQTRNAFFILNCTHSKFLAKELFKQSMPLLHFY